MFSGDIADLDATATLAAAEANLVARRRAEVERLLVLLHWCDLHTADPQSLPGAVPARYGGDRLVRIGGEGTPGVAELCFAEYAVAQGAGVVATRNQAADFLDLRHRLPGTHRAVLDLQLEVWVARRVAALSRRLSKNQAALVDAAVATAAAESPARVLAIAEAKVIEADPEAHRRRVADQEARTGVWLSRPRPGQAVEEVDGAAGVRRISARLAPADAVELDQTVEELAQALAEQYQPADDDDRPSHDQFRAQAIGLLADPHAAVAFLDGLTDSPDPGDAAERQPEQAAAPGKSARRRPATTFVHLHLDVLTGRVPGVARVEGLGPMLVEQVAALLGHRQVRITPVIDLNTGASVNGYEHPTGVRERTLLRTLGDMFPHSTSRTARRLDHDHATPYDPNGPPEQTGDHNDAPLTRHHHRAKTHRGFQVRQLGPGVYRWTTPHGLMRLVTLTGTYRLQPLHAADGTLRGEIGETRVAIEIDYAA